MKRKKMPIDRVDQELAEVCSNLIGLKELGWRRRADETIDPEFIRLEPLSESRCFCPLTALLFEKAGVYASPNRYEYAQQILHLSSHVADVVVNASDHANLRVTDRVLRRFILGLFPLQEAA
jgi:hypothetical protein